MIVHYKIEIYDFLKRFDKPKYKVGDIKNHTAYIAGMRIPYKSVKVYLLNNGRIDALRYWDIAFGWKNGDNVFETNYFNKRTNTYRRVRKPSYY